MMKPDRAGIQLVGTSRPGPGCLLLGAPALLALALACGGGGGASSPTYPPAVIAGFAATQSPITAAMATTLTATFSGGTGSIDQGVGPVTSGVPVGTGPLNVSTIFTLTVTNPGGRTVTSTAEVDVVPAPAITSFQAGSPITAGSPATLTGVFTGGTGKVTPGNLTMTSGVPVITAPLTTSEVFTLTVTDAAGTIAQATAPVVVDTVLNALTLTVDSPPAGASAWVNVFGPGGLISTTAGSESLSGLASGAYAVVPSGVWGTGTLAGQVFQASGGASLALASGDAAAATIAYTAVPSLTVQIPDASSPGATVPLALVTVPAGTFQMGAYAGEQDGQSLETPQHAVSFSHAIYLAEFPTTQEQYRAVTGTNPAYFSVANQGATTDAFTRPVESVSWNDVTGTFLAQLNAATASQRPQGTAFRLPTEAEWEYACRAGTTTRFFWGDDPFYQVLDHYAWWSFVSGDMTHPVGSLGPGSANPLGLFDMNGNVFEWCQDWYGPYVAGAQIDPSGPATGTYRVVRGGAWCYGDIYCRSANRSYSGVDDRYSSIGFRVVLAAAP